MASSLELHDNVAQVLAPADTIIFSPEETLIRLYFWKNYTTLETGSKVMEACMRGHLATPGTPVFYEQESDVQFVHLSCTDLSDDGGVTERQLSFSIRVDDVLDISQLPGTKGTWQIDFANDASLVCMASSFEQAAGLRTIVPLWQNSPASEA